MSFGFKKKKKRERGLSTSHGQSQSTAPSQTSVFRIEIQRYTKSPSSFLLGKK